MCSLRPTLRYTAFSPNFIQCNYSIRGLVPEFWGPNKSHDLTIRCTVGSVINRENYVNLLWIASAGLTDESVYGS